jgi:hypothetical protein
MTVLLAYLNSLFTVACAEPAYRPNVMAEGIYVRESEDQDWHVRIAGEIPSQCGAYLIVHDVNGKSVFHGVIPNGKYSADNPHLVKIKKDGVAGDYRIVMVGHQYDKMGVLAPWTDLPLEVYGGGNFSVGHDPIKVFFQAPPGVTEMHLGAYKGQLQIHDAEGKLVADTRKGKPHGRYDNGIQFKVEQGKTYRMARQCFYFRSYIANSLFIAFDAVKWFVPDARLNEVKWWEIPIERAK